jgi:hypothetical protein
VINANEYNKIIYECNVFLLDKYIFYVKRLMANYLVYVGIAIGVMAMGGAIAYGTYNQQIHISEDAVLAPAAEQGIISSGSGLGAQLNKEQWHEDTSLANIAKKVREQAGK